MSDSIPYYILFALHNIGFKLIPVADNGKTPAIDSTNKIYNIHNFWTDKKLQNECHRFKNVATTFGRAHIKDEKGEYLYLHGLDIDSDNVLRIIFDLLEELKSKTFVTKTKKDYGYHVYWFSHKHHPAIGTSKCRLGYEFEIKSDNSLGLCTLPPSTHRDDPHFKYTSVGLENKIVVDDELYEKLLQLLSNECLISDGGNGEEKNRREDISNGNGRSTSRSSTIYKNLADTDVERAISYIKDSYQKGYRDPIVFGLSGLLFKSNVALPSAKNLVSRLCDCTQDEEKNSRLEVLNSTYLKGLDGVEIKGAAQLLETLTTIHNGNKDSAKQVLENIYQVFSNSDVKEDDNDTNVSPSITQLLIQLVRDNTLLFFNDQYSIAYAKVQVAEHNEIIALGSTKFEYYVSKLYYDYSQEVVNQESLNNAIRVLTAQTLFDAPTRILNLRVAWGEEKDGKIYYDLADSEWRCIKITKQGWEVIAQDISVLFTRFNQKAQVEPDRNYSSGIFDRFLDLMHINDQGHRLLTKVWIGSLLIPDFPHPINITFGEKGGSKSTFCRFVKRLVDPDRIELLTIPKDKAEFVQQLYHNYLAVYDNIKQLPSWFSDEACKAVTGVGNSKRRFYTNDEDVIYNYKRCLMINGINNSLTEPDALDRSILTEFDRILPEQRKTEAKVEAEFEEMRSKLLGYILDILVKALQLKPIIELTNLPRMADFTAWGEAIVRAMGYKPMEFVNAYNENIGRQNVEAIESNPLAQAIDKFVDSRYKEGQVPFWEGSTKEALEQLNKIAQAYKIDTTGNVWPKAANSLVRKLRPILSNFREGLGINIVITRQTTGGSDSKNKKNTSTIRIEKISPLPPLSPPGQNHAQNQGESGGDILEGGDNTSTQQQISPPENDQNQAQKTESGGSGHSGDIIPSSILTASEESNADTLKVEQIENVSCCGLSGKYVSFDFEWITSPLSSEYEKEKQFPKDANIPINKITAAAFVDNYGTSKVLHISDYLNCDNPEQELLVDINSELLKHDYSLGWYSTGVAIYHEDTQEYLDGVDSDLAVLHNRCLANGIDSIIDFNNAGIPYIRGQKHIDLHNVFGKPIVQTTIFKNKYRTLKLDEVSKAVLGDSIEGGEVGKYKGLTGKDIHNLSLEEQKKYILRDVELVMQLSKHNNGEVLDAMKAISELTGLDFERVCRTGISTWWAAVFDNIISTEECQLSAVSSFDRNDEKSELQQYVGGIVLQPKEGLYQNLIVVDVASLYPSMAILYNISFDTVNCQCCKDGSEYRINGDITRDCKIQKEYWICRQKEGAFPKKLKVFKEERLKQKKLGNQVKQLVLKILINGGYGVFGSQYFKYYDPRVAELITAYGRHTLSKMQEIAKSIGFEIVYGDTDSLFLYNTAFNSTRATPSDDIISRFQEECYNQLGIEVEHAKTYTTAIISDKKKHYVGWTGIEGKEPDIVGMEGDKNDRPKWINTVFRNTVYDIVNNVDPITNLKKAIFNLESGSINPDLLKRSNRLSKNPQEYENENDRKRKIGLAIGARKGDVIEYFESDNNKEGYSLNLQDISVRKYKIMLWKAVKDILEIAGYNIATIEKDLICTNMTTQQSLQVAWSGKANLQTGGEI